MSRGFQTGSARGCSTMQGAWKMRREVTFFFLGLAMSPAVVIVIAAMERVTVGVTAAML